MTTEQTRKMLEHYKSIKQRLWQKPIAKRNWAKPIVQEVPIWGNSLKRMFKELLKQHDIKPDEIRSGKKTHTLTLFRQEFCYRAASEKNVSLKQIGRLIGRDQTTVMHSIQKHAHRHNLPLPRGMTNTTFIKKIKPKEANHDG